MLGVIVRFCREVEPSENQNASVLIGPFPSITFTYGDLRAGLPSEEDWIPVASAHDGLWIFNGRKYSDMDLEPVEVSWRGEYADPENLVFAYEGEEA